VIYLNNALSKINSNELPISMRTKNQKSIAATGEGGLLATGSWFPAGIFFRRRYYWESYELRAASYEGKALATAGFWQVLF
jgi:hypothetical protein